jgi:UDP-N-acetylmuramate dehydrogenase
MDPGYTLEADVSLRGLNTFGVAAHAPWLLTVHAAAAIPAALADPRIAELPLLCLGDGSNVLFVDDFPGVVLRLTADGVATMDENPGGVLVRADAGLSWDALVDWTLTRGLAGLENLALIPGRVGAAPIQNIGAYGTEMEEFVATVHAWDRATGRALMLARADCGFTYRDSRFKHETDRWVVTTLELRLPRSRPPRLDYPGVREELGMHVGATPPVREIAAAIRRIRRRKLPDPAVIGNAGSFFKNPIGPTSHARDIAASTPGLPSYDTGAPELRKLSAAWLIEACGWRGHRDGDAGVSSRHALVLVNHGEATGRQLLSLAQRIAESVRARFGVVLVPEPRIVGANFRSP